MSTVDWGAIRSAIATSAGQGTGIGSAGADGISLSTLGDLPAVKVIAAETIGLSSGRGGRTMAVHEAREADIVGVLLVDTSAGNGEGLNTVEPYVEQMFERARVGITLGLDYVEQYWLDRAEIGEVDWGGETYVGAVLYWTVHVRQTDLDRTA